MFELYNYIFLGKLYNYICLCFCPLILWVIFIKKIKKIDRYLLWKVLNGNFVRRFYQLKNNNWWVFVLYSILYFDSYNLIKKFVWCILLKANQIQNEQVIQWLGSCFLIGGSQVQLPYFIFFKNLFNLKKKKKKKKKKREREEPVQPITRPCHRFLRSLTGYRRASCMADPKVCSNRSTHRSDRSSFKNMITSMEFARCWKHTWREWWT